MTLSDSVKAKRKRRKSAKIPSWATFNAFKERSNQVLSATPDGLVPRLTERQQMALLKRQTQPSGSRVSSSSAVDGVGEDAHPSDLPSSAIDSVTDNGHSSSIYEYEYDDEEKFGNSNHCIESSIVDNNQSTVTPAKPVSTNATSPEKIEKDPEPDHQVGNDLVVSRTDESEMQRAENEQESDEMEVETIEEDSNQPTLTESTLAQNDFSCQETTISVSDASKQVNFDTEVTNAESISSEHFPDNTADLENTVAVQDILGDEQLQNTPETSAFEEVVIPEEQEIRDKMEIDDAIPASPPKTRSRSLKTQLIQQSPRKSSPVRKLPQSPKDHKQQKTRAKISAQIEEQRRHFDEALRRAVNTFDMQHNGRRHWWVGLKKAPLKPTYMLSESDIILLAPKWKPQVSAKSPNVPKIDLGQLTYKLEHMYKWHLDSVHSETRDALAEIQISALYHANSITNFAKESYMAMFRFYQSFEDGIAQMLLPNRPYECNRFDDLRCQTLFKIASSLKQYVLKHEQLLLQMIQYQKLQRKSIYRAILNDLRFFIIQNLESSPYIAWDNENAVNIKSNNRITIQVPNDELKNNFKQDFIYFVDSKSITIDLDRMLKPLFLEYCRPVSSFYNIRDILSS